MQQANQIAVNTFQQYSDKYGYLRSLSAEFPVDANGATIPLYTYPAYEYLQKFNFKSTNFFGYSAGVNSIWWAQNTKSAITVETDVNIHNFVGTRKIENLASINIYIEDVASFLSAISKTEDNTKVVEVSGNMPDKCAEYLEGAISQKVVSPFLIILNNSTNVPSAKAILNRLEDYIEIDFCGLSPSSGSINTTSIYVSRVAETLDYKNQY